MNYTGDERAGEHAFDRRSGRLGQKIPHLVDGECLDAVGHEFEAEHENAETADHGNEDVLEDVDLHVGMPSCVDSAGARKSALVVQGRQGLCPIAIDLTRKFRRYGGVAQRTCIPGAG